jgi:hypothetical protein
MLIASGSLIGAHDRYQVGASTAGAARFARFLLLSGALL